MRRSGSCVAVAIGIALLAAPARAEDEAEPAAVVALIGAAGANTELAAVLSELLERQGVKPEIESEDRFDPDALLSQGEHDAHVRVFVVVRGEHEARLYFRGPRGERFLLRKLQLRSGLDEVGRELIAQVVETSTVALLRSSAGISRDEASASLSEERAEVAPPKVVAPPPPVPVQPAKARPLPAPELFGAIGGGGALFQWKHDGGPAWGGELEAALGLVFPSRWVVRGWLGGDYLTPQTGGTGAVNVTTSSYAVRAGVEFGRMFGRFGLLLGLGAGADFDHATAATGASSVKLAGPIDSTAPIFRGQIRFDEHLGHFWASPVLFADFPAVHTHYDFVEGPASTRALDLWAVRPGVFITVGWSSFAPHDTGQK